VNSALEQRSCNGDLVAIGVLGVERLDGAVAEVEVVAEVDLLLAGGDARVPGYRDEEIDRVAVASEQAAPDPEERVAEYVRKLCSVIFIFG
jgi:hypothetical protein